jgi:polar amino acid transport system permease protein
MERSGTITQKKGFRDKAEWIQFIRIKIRTTPWWLVGIILIAVLTVFVIATKDSYHDAFIFITAGLSVTISTTVIAFLIALVLGLLTGLGRISGNTLFRNLATLYVEIVRGIPMLVLIFFIAFVGVPGVVDGIKSLGNWFSDLGWSGPGTALSGIENNGIPMNTRAIIALSTTYGAFLAEIFRAGIQSIDRGQMEAARSQGMTYWQAMRYIILPQAIRNVLPALGNDFISMLKDSSLVSVLAVRDITQIARLYAGRSFQFRESYLTLAVLYLTMTVFLSFLMKIFERRIHKNEQR